MTEREAWAQAVENGRQMGFEEGYAKGLEDAVRHGRWIPMYNASDQNNWIVCSECKTVGSPFWKRCPVCEAKMDGGNEDV